MNLQHQTNELKLILINNQVQQLNKGFLNGEQTEKLLNNLIELTIKEINQLSELTEEQKFNITQSILTKYI